MKNTTSTYIAHGKPVAVVVFLHVARARASLNGMKRRRLRSKQRPPPCYEQIEEVEDGHVLPEAATAAVAVGESQADGVDPAEAERADTIAAMPDAVGSDGSENLDSCDRWHSCLASTRLCRPWWQL